MSYFGELSQNRRALAATCIGMSSGYLLGHYINGIFAPFLIAEFGWSKSQYALIGMAILGSLISLPISGRLTDLYGVRRMAGVGVVLCPLIYVGYSAMTGSFSVFFVLNLLNILLVASTTTSLVYSRLIAQKFSAARGLALAVAGCSPAAIAAVIAPLLSDFIDVNGWRAGYLAVAALTAIGGCLALFLVPKADGGAPARRTQSKGSTVAQYREILKNRNFQIIIFGKFLCNITLMVQASQLKLVLEERHLAPDTAAWMISLYVSGIVMGRIICGLALDRFPPQIVTAWSLGLPGLGFLVLASGASSPMVLACAVLIIGLSMGAESDITGYLVMRFFSVENYSTIYSLVGVSIAAAGAIGSLLLSLTIYLSGGFELFFLIAAVATVVGALAFLMLGRSVRNPESSLEVKSA